MRIFLGYYNGATIWQTEGKILSLEEVVKFMEENYIKEEEVNNG